MLWFALLFVRAAHSFSFVVAGDFGINETFRSIVTAMSKTQSAFVVAAGDLSYEKDQEQAWCEVWKQANFDHVLLVAGNHDTGEGEYGNLQSYIDECPQSLPVSGIPGVRYYVDYPVENPLARIVLISPGVLGSLTDQDTYSAQEENYLWVERVLDDAKLKHLWVIVVMHKNFISTLHMRQEVENDLMELLFLKKVDIIVQGHEHAYLRTKQLVCADPKEFMPHCVSSSGNSLRAGSGTTIIIIGTGGRSLDDYRVINDSMLEYFHDPILSYGFGKLEISAARISFDFVPLSEADSRDHFEVRRLGVKKLAFFS